jgi:NAD(P)H dehydrogenase (quinone)
MVSTKDIGRCITEVLRETWDGVRVVELEGPKRYSANDIGSAFASALVYAVRMEPVPRDTWEARFRAQGMKHPIPRIRMVDGFNEGWIDFEGRDAEQRKGSTTLDEVIARLVKRTPQ